MKVSVIRSVLILSPHLAIATPNEVFDTEYVCRDSLYAHITTLQLLVFSKVSRCVVFTSASTVLTTRTSEPHTMTHPLIVCHISFYYPTRQQTRDRSTPQPARVPSSYKFCPPSVLDSGLSTLKTPMLTIFILFDLFLCTIPFYSSIYPYHAPTQCFPRDSVG